MLQNEFAAIIEQLNGQYGVERSTLKQVKTMFIAGNSAAMKEGGVLKLPREKDKDASQNLAPADFLIDEDLIVRKAHYGGHLNDHISIEEITAFAGITFPLKR